MIGSPMMNDAIASDWDFGSTEGDVLGLVIEGWSAIWLSTRPELARA